MKILFLTLLFAIILLMAHFGAPIRRGTARMMRLTSHRRLQHH